MRFGLRERTGFDAGLLPDGAAEMGFELACGSLIRLFASAKGKMISLGGSHSKRAPRYKAGNAYFREHAEYWYRKLEKSN